MKRRNFIKGCLGFPALALLEIKTKPTKKIKMYVSSSKTRRSGVEKLNWIEVKYGGKERLLRGDALVWQSDGTVCRPKFAGVSACDI